MSDGGDWMGDAVIAQGKRRIRRRRAGTLLGTAVVALVVVAAGLSAVRMIRDDAEPAAKPPIPFTERRPTYALNGVIHFGDAEISTGTTRLARYVQTDVGFVFADRDQIKLADGRTTRTLADATSDSPVVASGALAGWEEPTTSGTRTIIRDLRTDDVVYQINRPSGAHSSPPAQPTGGLVALDGNSAYFTTTGGLFRLDVRTHLGQLIRPSYPVVVKSALAEFSTYAYLDMPPEGTGKYVVATGGTLRVYDGHGRQYVIVTGAQPTTFGQWLNDTTFTAADAPGGDQPVNLLKCWVPAGLTMSCGIAKSAIATNPQDLTFPSN
ncbi:hypothetical protein AB0E63_03070 [Kribbella sp. NPDC026596]|uniref:hypothetical protein n=1 Tax=Kribbella sp. NPDC026596 TaxID=3155122 RepID=UPI0033E08DB8